jgi:tRNA uridine 5-carboxymethylaminomethyl modification enzyme
MRLLPDGVFNNLESRTLVRASIELKYEGYIKRAEVMQDKLRALEDAAIPEQLFLERIPGLSIEIFEKLTKFRPKTLGQASRIQGITPAAIGLIAIEIKRQKRVTNDVA